MRTEAELIEAVIDKACEYSTTPTDRRLYIELAVSLTVQHERLKMIAEFEGYDAEAPTSFKLTAKADAEIRDRNLEQLA